MNHNFSFIIAALLIAFAGFRAEAQFNLGKAINSAKQVGQALTLSDQQMAAYAKESVDWMDTHNKVSDENSEYTRRLRRLTDGLTDVDGIP